MKPSHSLLISLALVTSFPALASPSGLGSIRSSLHASVTSPEIIDFETGGIGTVYYDKQFEGAGSNSFDAQDISWLWPDTSVSATIELTENPTHARIRISGYSFNQENANFGDYDVGTTFVLLAPAEFTFKASCSWGADFSGGFYLWSLSHSYENGIASGNMPQNVPFVVSGILSPGTYSLGLSGRSYPYHHGSSSAGSMDLTLDVIPEPATASLFLTTALAALAIRPRR